MAVVTIGLFNDSETANFSNVPTGGTTAVSGDDSVGAGYSYLAVGGEIIDTVGARFKSPAVNRNIKFALYETDGTVLGAIGGSGAFVTGFQVVPSTIADPENREFSVGPWALEAGKRYMIAVLSDTAGTFQITDSGVAGSAGHRDNALAVADTFNDPWDNDTTWTTDIHIWARGNTSSGEVEVKGGVGDSTTTPARGGAAGGGDNTVTNIGGVTSSVIGVSPNQPRSIGPDAEGPRSTGEILVDPATPVDTDDSTMTADHVFRNIGGGASTANSIATPSVPDTEVAHEARIYDAATDSFGAKAVRHVLASAQAAPDAAIPPSTFENKTKDEVNVEIGEGVFGVEP